MVVQTKVGDCEMTVYNTGFAVYQNDLHYTVLRMEHVGKANYYSEPLDKRECIGVEDEDWTIGVMVSGEDRIEDRYWIKAEQRLTSMYTVSDDGEWEEREFDSGEDFVEEYIAKLEREAAKAEVDKMLSCLTERQREIYTLYHLQGLTQVEIAKMLGIDQTAISKSLQSSEKKIKKFLKF